MTDLVINMTLSRGSGHEFGTVTAGDTATVLMPPGVTGGSYVSDGASVEWTASGSEDIDAGTAIWVAADSVSGGIHAPVFALRFQPGKFAVTVSRA